MLIIMTQRTYLQHDLTYDCRRMKGDELDELNLDELRKLEKTIEAGLSRVIGTKVDFLLFC